MRNARSPGEGERPDWLVVEAKGEEEGERPDWVVGARGPRPVAETEPSTEPSAGPARLRSSHPGARRAAREARSSRPDQSSRYEQPSLSGRSSPSEQGSPSEKASPPGQSDWVAEAEAELAASTARGRGRRAGRPAREPRATAPSAAEADPAARARDICLRLLTGTPRTRRQLATALRKREIPDEVAEEVLSRFEEVGLIDDAAFAAAWVESRHHGRGLARRALAQELRTRGVAGALVEEAVAQLDPDEEAATARALVERKLRATTGLERQARLRRLVGMLARRGYSEGLAFRVVREALDAEGESTEELEEWSLGSD
ncbi:recombination regulator RecX [Kitasatospora sp. NPDC008050]|uniref:recombination regulator RecX n=1 Tax=Kitasatospora sp. NPDC008050 TaxID=3364021 RepID=UPI0036E9B791